MGFSQVCLITRILIPFLLCCWVVESVNGIGVNWGTQYSHPLRPETVVQMLKENGIQQVKLFDADYGALKALRKSGIQVIVGIPNDMLATMASSRKAAEKWVSKNVSKHIDNNVDIRYVAVGNEPFLAAYNGSYIVATFPAVLRIQAALVKAGLGRVKVIVPHNADVYESSTGVPSGGDFRANIHNTMIQITTLLNDFGSPFTVNIYPFISLYADSSFPVEYAFFDEGNGTPVVNDGGITYTNMFDANYDTLVWALEKNGFKNMGIMVGEIGWPSDGDRNANNDYAQRFMQGFMNHVNKGTPMRTGPIDVYLFSLIDEDDKSIQLGKFERHWGVFAYDGQPKYSLNLGTSNSGYLIPATFVDYLPRKWCVINDSAKLDDPSIAQSVSYACALGDCTSLGYGSSCGDLDVKGNISYAFNSYYQKNNQADEACNFPNVSMITTEDPSIGTCRFEIMIKPYFGGADRSIGRSWVMVLILAGVLICFCFLGCVGDGIEILRRNLVDRYVRR